MSRFSEVALAAVHAVRRLPGVEFADVRVIDDEHEVTTLGDGAVEQERRDRSTGVGVRVRRDGAWGFAAAAGSSEEVAVQAARQAVEIAAAGDAAGQLVAEEPAIGAYRTPLDVDPFAVPLATRLADLERALGGARETDAAATASATMRWWRSTRAFASTEGSRLEQVLVGGGATVEVVARAAGEAQRRTVGGVAGRGYEHLASLGLEGEARRAASEARALLSAPACPAEVTTLVLAPSCLAHQLCFHLLAGDVPGPLGRFVFGAPRINLVADARLAGAAGSFGWDDEGVPARRTPLVSRGILVGVLASRERAAALGLGRAPGCQRAAAFATGPDARATNLVLDSDPAGPASLAELVADTGRGVLIADGAAWQIEGGKPGRILRAPSLDARPASFWRACDAIGGPDSLRLLGLAGEGAAAAIGVAAPPARFRDVALGARS